MKKNKSTANSAPAARGAADKKRKPARLFLGLFILTAITGLAEGAINYTPSSPNVEQSVTFTLQTASSPNSVRWDFGDGTVQIVVGSMTVSHTYMRSGTFIVRAAYNVAAPVTETVNITIRENRRITYTPASPRINQSVSFRALNFFSSSIRWNFGDGSAPVTGGSTQSHTFRTPGSYRVSVRDFSGNSSVDIEVTVMVIGAASITFSPARPRVGDTVAFTAGNFGSTTLIRWDFGDGSVVNDNSPPSVNHRFTRAGTFLVRAYDGGGNTVTASVSIRVYAQASIRFSPADPRPGEEVVFEALNFFSSTLIRWDFGDGNVQNDSSPPTVSHIYANPGTYMVRAYDNGGGTVTASLMIQILPPRAIAVSPLQPRTGEVVTLTAVNFLSGNIRWEFGDGESLASGSTQVTHIYGREGIYNVIAWDMRNGTALSTARTALAGTGGRRNLSVPVNYQLTVVPSRGPRAPFSISLINLRFEDGKSYRVVNRGFQPVVAFADIKYEGTGIFYAQWLVDGSPVGLVSRSLAYADSITIDSGLIPGLPTLIQGIHDVTLKIIQPATEFAVPAIRYFVTSEGAAEQINLDLNRSIPLDEGTVKLAENFVLAPPNRHFLLKGRVINESAYVLPVVLLRIYLDEEMVDQKLLKSLNPDEEREFESSIYNTAGEGKKIVILLYNISREPADLVYVKELSLVDQKK